MTRAQTWQTYNVLKESEGGPGQDCARWDAIGCGAEKAVGEPSVLIGHTAIRVLATKRQHQKIARVLYR